MRSQLEGKVSVVVLDFFVVTLTQIFLYFVLPRGSEGWVLAIYGRNFINGPLTNPILKCANFNRRQITNCTSVYQMQLCTFSSALIIGRRPFAFIKVSIYSDTIDYLLCNQYRVHLSEKDTNKENGAQFIWSYFYCSILRYKDI